MKAEIKGKTLILSPETKKDSTELKKFLKQNDASVIIPKNRKQLSYWKIIDLSLLINL
jgi:hypothetical protein